MLEFKKVLQLDPYNKAARRWLERIAATKSDYYRAAYDQTRARASHGGRQGMGDYGATRAS